MAEVRIVNARSAERQGRTRHGSRRKLAVGPTLLIAAALLLQQAAAQAQQPAVPRWSLTAVTGRATGGPAQDLEAWMVAERFDADAPCVLFCSPPGVNPFSSTDDSEFPWLLELQYRHSGRAGAALLASTVGLGTTIGYRAAEPQTPPDPQNPFGDHLFIRYTVSLLGGAMVLSHGPLSVHAGPAVYRLTSWQHNAGRDLDHRTVTRARPVAGAGVSLPVWRALGVHARVQYRAAGVAELGPFSTSRGDVGPATGSFSHWFGGAGVGVRFE